MSKFKYLFKRIINMNFDNFFKTVKEIKKETKLPYLFVFFDVVLCGLKYQAGYLDYKYFEMYNLKTQQRKTILTRGINNEFIKKYNNPKFAEIFENKDQFNVKFKKFIKRDYMILNEDNEIEFNKFIKDKKEIIVKPTNGTHGDGVRKIKPNKNTYKELVKESPLLCEEVIEQIDEMNKLNKSSVNTIRVITFNNKGKCSIIVAYLRVGNNKVVDNFNGGGMVVPVNVKTHKVEYPAIDKNNNLYYKHPSTNTNFIGFVIPDFDKIEKLVSDASKIIPEVKYVGWDVALSKKGPCLVEGNSMPGHDIYQLPAHRKNGIGILPKFEKIMKR